MIHAPGFDPLRPFPPERRYQIGQWLEKARHREGATQAEFAQTFGISCQTYQRWELYGPPSEQTTMFIILMLRRLADRERWRAWKRKQRADAKARKTEFSPPGAGSGSPDLGT